MQMPSPPPHGDDFGVVETSPPLPGRLLGHKRRSVKTISTDDLVEPMLYLYVRVLEIIDLLPDILQPYVLLKIGCYKAITEDSETFAISKEIIHSDVLQLVVKDKHHDLKDETVGRITFHLSQLPPHSPLVAPQWYQLEDKMGQKLQGEILLAVWMGTQADEAYRNARHSDTLNLPQESMVHTRSHVYYSPKLCYLRLHIIEAQDLVPSDNDRVTDLSVKIQLGRQVRYTQSATVHSVNPIWNEELMFVVSEPFNEHLVLIVEDRVGRNQYEPLVEEGGEKEEVKLSSKIHLCLCLDDGYGVFDGLTHCSSDVHPSSKALPKPSIGILELGILSARNLIPPKKSKEGRCTDAYCVAKYGSKWVRTRTMLDTLSPRWNEQYTWEVYDPCTVITISVFDNCQIIGKKDQRIGKVRIRLSMLETDRIYTHFYPLVLIQPCGQEKTGQLHLAIRFTCIGWVNMVALYSRPLLPKMHYVQPISSSHSDFLWSQAIIIVTEWLSRSEPPLQREVVEYMLDVDSNMWNLRRSKANFERIMSLLSGVHAVAIWLDDVRNWKNSATTCLMHVLFLIPVCYPKLILPTMFLYLFLRGIWNYRFRPQNPPHMDTWCSHVELHPDELDEEFDTFPTSRASRMVVRMRYDRLRSILGRLQTIAEDLAAQGEMAQAILSWHDPRATALFIFFLLVLAVFLYVTPFQVVCVLVGLYLLRHPRFRFRNKMPPMLFNFYKRLPSKLKCNMLL